MDVRWPQAQRAILEALTTKVLVLSESQIKRGFFSSTQAKLARGCLDSLAVAGLIEKHIVEAHPMLPLKRKVFSWKPGEAHPTTPELVGIEEKLRRRWQQPPEPAEVFLATRRAANLFGSDARRPPTSEQATHDLHLSEIYIRYRKTKPKLAQTWCGEFALPKLGKEVRFMKDPDAFILDDAGKAKYVIEFAGKYDRKHLFEIHAHCSGGAHRKLEAFRKKKEISTLESVYPRGGVGYELW